MKLTFNLIAASVLGLLIVLFKTILIQMVNNLFLIYSRLSQLVDYFFQHGPISQALVYVITVLLLIGVIYLPITLLYRLIMRKPLPYKNHFLWALWFVVNLAVCMPLYLLGTVK